MSNSSDEETDDELDMYFSAPHPAPPTALDKWSAQQKEAILKIINGDIPVVVTDGTVSRRKTVIDLVERVNKAHNNICPIKVCYIISALYPNPSTTIAYINTAAHLFPKMKQHPEWRDHHAHFTKLGNQYSPQAKQANALDAQRMKKLILTWNGLESHHYTTMFIWLTASRHGDLKHMLWIKESEKSIPQHNLMVAIVDMRGSKGDPKGERGDQKAVILPQAWYSIIKAQCVRDKKKIMSRYFYMKAIRTNTTTEEEEDDEELSGHSCRRGASQTLAALGYAKAEIQQLTLQQQGARKATRSQDVYQNGLYLTDPREQNQIRLQLVLLEQLHLISRSTMLYVSQEWLPKAYSASQGTLLTLRGIQ